MVDRSPRTGHTVSERIATSVSPLTVCPGDKPNGPDLGHTFRGNRTALFPGTGNLSEVLGDAISKAFLKRWATNWATDFMSDSIQFRVRFDPRPVIQDSRALVQYREVHESLVSLIARQLNIPQAIASEIEDTNYSSASLDPRIQLYASTRRMAQMAARKLCERYWLLRRQHGHRLFREQLELYYQHHISLPAGLRNRRQRKLRTYLIIRFCDRYYQRLARYYK